MKNRLALIASILLLVRCHPADAVAEPSVEASALPRTQPVEPKDVLSTFQVKPGFHLELAACEPLVVDPIAMCFDENGRMFVIEMRDYSERRDERLGRIRVLEDTDGDGRYDKSTVYAEDLAWPTALFYYKGSLFVGCTPDILLLKDTDGDGKADQRQVVYTGFAAGVARLNVQGLINNFQWSLDNRIHGATGLNGAKVTSPHFAGKALELHGKDFSFDPRNLSDFTAESGGGQHGLSFDNEGHKYVCHNSDHIRLVMYDERYANRNPWYNMPPPVISIAVDGPAAEVYRISPDEPWRVLRTQWRVSGKVSGPIEGGGRASGYFTSAAGITIYRGNAFPPEYLGDAFIADVGSNLIHRKKIEPDGVGFKAERAPGEQKVEFIASKDLWFRPVQFANAPDGTLFVADMYREVIEHPWSIPESIKKHLDLNSGNDRGRIYRIAPDGFKPPAPPRLGKASSRELVEFLAHPNGWHRDTAARLLYERQDKGVAGDLEALVKSNRSSLGPLHALYALEGLGALKVETLQAALKNPQAAVREHALKVLEKEAASHPGEAKQLWPSIESLAADASLRVRYQLAFSLGSFKDMNPTPVLASIIRRDFANSWVRAAVLSSIGRRASEMLDAVSAQDRILQSKAGQEFLGQLLFQIGAAHEKEQVEKVVQFLTRDLEPAALFALVRSLSDGLARGGSSLAKSQVDLGPVLKRAEALAMQPERDEMTRISAVQLMGSLPFSEVGDKLLSLLSAQQSQPLQLAAVQALKKYSEPVVAAELLKRWLELSPRLRSDVLAALLERPERALQLLKAISHGSVLAAELTSSQTQFLLAHKQKEVRESAAGILGKLPRQGRSEVVTAFLPALNLKGDAAKGKVIYEQRCASCHRAGSLGSAVGPDLVTVKTAGREKVLINIVDPNREVAPNYFTYLVETANGESILGILARETGGSVILRQAFGKEETIPRSKIISMRNQGQSLMPEGLEAGLDAQGVADLLEFIEGVEAPAK
jgi:putative membrane-bound dehydrogenase-like protein